MAKLLPVGIQSFEGIVHHNYRYVNRTGYLHQLVKAPKGSYSIHRPRRSGKNLLASTLKALFEAKRELFKDFCVVIKNTDVLGYPNREARESLARHIDIT